MDPLSETTLHTKVPTVREQLAMGLFDFFKKGTNAIERTNTYKSAAKGMNRQGRNLTRRMKTVKRVFTGEGEMMKLYSTLRAYFDAGDVRGLQSYIAYLGTYQPGFGSAKEQKKQELIAYGELLLAAAKGENISQQANTLSGQVNTRHEIGRKIRADLYNLQNPEFNNNNSVNINFYKGPMGFNYEGYMAAQSARKRKSRRRN